MNKYLLKDNEIAIFVDFNSTLVDFDDEYNSTMGMYERNRTEVLHLIKQRLNACLSLFEKKTGLTPVICVVTNASLNTIDNNQYPGIHRDLHMTFFDHTMHNEEQARYVYEHSCEKYFKYLVYKENDVFFKINPLARTTEEMFDAVPFGEDALAIRYIERFKKKESVARMETLLDPDKTKSKFIIFAGDSIEQDYPMKLYETPEGVCKIFIRPGKVQRMKPSIMYQFCKAKGLEFKSVHPRTGKLIRSFDDESIKWLSEEEQKMLAEFDDGDIVLLTHRYSRGLVEGLYQAIDIINSRKGDSDLERTF